MGYASLWAGVAVLAVAGSASAAKPQPTQPAERHYFYAGAAGSAPGGGEITSAAGAVTHHAPSVRAENGDVHSHASIAMVKVGDDHKRDIVEAGWIIHPGETKPHLYVAPYVNDGGIVEDGHAKLPSPAFVSLGDPKPGDPLEQDGNARAFALEHLESDPVTNSGCCPGWYLRYDGRWIGYFPDSLWETTTKRRGKTLTTPSDFTFARSTAWFGEVLSSRPTPCGDMGNGLHGIDPRAGSFSDLTVNGEPFLPTPANYLDRTRQWYSTAALTTTGAFGIRFGGPGAAENCA